MNKIIPSIIAKNKNELKVKLLLGKIAKTLHLDIMDGKFVKNKSLNFPLKLPKNNKYEAHLMTKDPQNWIKKNHGKVDLIIVHIEAVKNIEEIISIIKSKKKKVGIAINPETKVEKIKDYLKEIDMVLIMSVHPGKYGAKFLPKTLEKVKKIKKLNPKLEIEIDGGMDTMNIYKAKIAGVDKFVVGSYLQNSENKKEAMRNLRKA